MIGENPLIGERQVANFALRRVNINKLTEETDSFGLDCTVLCTVPLFENCALLGFCAVSSGNFVPTFRDNFPVLSSRVRFFLFLTPEV
jgi:hypothetical protein